MEKLASKDKDDARWRFAERLPAGTPERNMTEWLNNGLHNAEAMAIRYLCYAYWEKRANQMRLKRDGGPAVDWLAHGYYLPVGIFFQTLEKYCWDQTCHALETGGGAGSNGDASSVTLKSFHDLVRQIYSGQKMVVFPRQPEFSLEESELKRRFTSGKEATRQSSAEHAEHAERLRGLCEGDLLLLPEEIVQDYATPLWALANTHHNLAFSAEFSPYHMLEDPDAYLK